ncbi:mannitol dehydrogenase family protein [Georgenia ruanii]|uniref:Mannitol dehydrogenase family protein n=1 Tax=Georgenia ruanii TaxID=348442 RepID=A0A7J9UWJ0_9MICO|nr:mannitol dehydrogenase family protein [Georgenia ruanii]MPV88250.1 mannitol dehydrogenase family protein [Georgenia ruanii]
MTTALPRLSRSAHGRPAAPVRIVHLGIGNFTRAHQAWYTEHAPDAGEWGIAAFTGRRPDTAEALAPQDGLYTLITRRAEGDAFEVISSLSAVHAAAETAAFLDYLRAPTTAILTTTVTEAGYMRGADGHLAVDNADVAADIAALQADPTATTRTTPAKVVGGFLARRAAGAGALTVLPCDNLPDNGPSFRTVVQDLAARVDPTLQAWMDENVAWATSMVDRITPATTDAERQAVADSEGYEDASPVPTEPFSEWVVAGAFPAGRPAWDAAGVTLVDDVRPFEQRKLWLLNGSHSLMAYAATILGHETVADAVADPTVRGWVEEWWDVAGPNLPLSAEEVTSYRAALLDRFSNPRVRHLLAQIAADGSQKIPVRILPALRLERQAGRLPDGAVRPLAAWVLHLQGHGAPVKDARQDDVVAAAQGDVAAATTALLRLLAPDMLPDDELVAAVVAKAEELRAQEGAAGR